MSKIKDVAIDEMNKMNIKNIESDGFIIDVREVGKCKTTTSWQIDLLFNSFQVVLTFYQTELEDKNDYRMEISFSEIVLTKYDEDNILKFLINESSTF